MSLIARNDIVEQEFNTISFGNGMMKAASAKNGVYADHTDYSGFYIECGKNADLDDALKAAGFAVIESEHPNDHGQLTYKKQWDLGRNLDLYPITSGVPAKTVRLCLSPRNQRKLTASGIGLGWYTISDGRNKGKSQSVFGVICYIAPLVAVGYVEPIKFGVRGMMTDYVVPALADHTRVAKFADTIVDRDKHPETVGLWEIRWSIGRGEKKVPFKGKNGASSLVYPVISKHPNELHRDYIVDMYLQGDARKMIMDRLESDWNMVQDWAAQFNAMNATLHAADNAMTYEGIIVDFVDAENGRPAKWTLCVDDDTLIPCVWWNKNIEDIGDRDTVQVTGSYKTNQYGEQFVVEDLSVTYRDRAPF